MGGCYRPEHEHQSIISCWSSSCEQVQVAPETLVPGSVRLDIPAFAHLSSSDWPNLKNLDLGYSLIPVSAKAIAVLAKGKWPVLRRLSLPSSGFCSARVMSELVRGHFLQLKTLHLFRNAFPPEASAHLIKGNWPCLEVLRVSFSAMHESVMETLARGNWPNLQVLEVEVYPTG